MKRTSFIFSVIVVSCALFFWSCKKDSNNNPGGNGGGGTVITDDFNIIYTDVGTFPANAQLIFDAAPVGTPIPAYAGNFPSNVDAELANEGTTKDKVISIKGKSLKVTITNNPGQNLDFMDSVWVYVSKVDGSSKYLFGYSYNYPLGKRELDLTMTEFDVKEVFNSDSVKLALTGTKRAGSHTIMANTEVEFRAEIEGIFDVTP